VVRFKIWDAGYEASVATLRDALGEKDFDSAWAEGAALSTEEAIAYAQRSRGERKRPASGWASLTGEPSLPAHRPLLINHQPFIETIHELGASVYHCPNLLT
jgi:hypothetical protein